MISGWILRGGTKAVSAKEMEFIHEKLFNFLLESCRNCTAEAAADATVTMSLLTTGIAASLRRTAKLSTWNSVGSEQNYKHQYLNGPETYFNCK